MSSVDPIDQLLATLQAGEGRRSSPRLADASASRPETQSPRVSSSQSLDNLLEALEQSEQPPQPCSNQNPRQTTQQRRDLLRQQRRTALVTQAQQWLQQLNPSTEEGRWFEDFACSYESPLEAAIDYLEALQDVMRSSKGT